MTESGNEAAESGWRGWSFSAWMARLFLWVTAILIAPLTLGPEWGLREGENTWWYEAPYGFGLFYVLVMVGVACVALVSWRLRAVPWALCHAAAVALILVWFPYRWTALSTCRLEDDAVCRVFSAFPVSVVVAAFFLLRHRLDPRALRRWSVWAVPAVTAVLVLWVVMVPEMPGQPYVPRVFRNWVALRSRGHVIFAEQQFGGFIGVYAYVLANIVLFRLAHGMRGWLWALAQVAPLAAALYWSARRKTELLGCRLDNMHPCGLVETAAAVLGKASW